ncbi:2-amino-4-hydroxy-6-hydroxymethyldihydropteridine pyrophosphokinase [Deferribacter desulfuricans SSM1]|uniref:2-amino-4-hydroxy-6-hydroxymethyldihydropteridine pyrophosphokinase n=1 Tax=Deferribacter desulfuricans (strain DSM 14783 / JCM 11476 / NBRC 101012 / SSM1) TaxID=639282 RepID=D3PEE8_DEFDS|nr:2-amino-4-hydroxy-6-hydroxymethyldihydropteridine diphosphokinase [Deferribacter desulfuricans]BAI80971.1 2-amino-4-hydroxy-6-hydroxymethyldihydropteridine pyrophosphokinase [Deferribacter desulfuricans SSM1]
MVKVILGLGSNLGDRVQNIYSALKSLEKNMIFIKRISPIYSTKSLLRDNQPDYLNLVAVSFTNLQPENILFIVKKIEDQMGRKKIGKWKERIIDIDIIDYNGEIIKSGNLKVPHPEFTKRSFVLYPMLDIERDYLHPEYEKGLTYFIKNLEDDLGIKKVGELKWL